MFTEAQIANALKEAWPLVHELADCQEFAQKFFANVNKAGFQLTAVELSKALFDAIGEIFGSRTASFAKELPTFMLNLDIEETLRGKTMGFFNEEGHKTKA